MNEIVKELSTLVGGVRSDSSPEYDKKRKVSKEAKENHGLNVSNDVFYNIAQSTNSKGKRKHRTLLESHAHAIPLEDDEGENNSFDVFNN